MHAMDSNSSVKISAEICVIRLIIKGLPHQMDAAFINAGVVINEE